MKLLVGLRVLVALALCAPGAAACPCSDDAGGASLVRADERYALSLVASSRRTLGRFDAFGQYRSLERGELEFSEELLLRAGLRVPRKIEWLGELGAASYGLRAPGLSEGQAGLGDASLRVRYRARDESMPHERLLLPSVTLSALVRAPVGAISRERGTSFGSGGVQLGLGTWEVGVGVEAVRSLSARFDALMSGEVAYRLPDQALDARRHLGPRADVAVGARAQPVPWLAASALVRARVTGDVELAGRSIAGTGERLGSLILGAAFFEPSTRLRSSVSLSIDPPIAAFSRGATATYALSVALGYGVR